MKNRFSTIAGWIVIVLILCQFIPLNRVDLTARIPATIPDDVAPVLKEHCLTCHSGQTRWPRSAYIAPLSWYVTSRVRQARQALDFSDYDALSLTAKRRIATTVSAFARKTDIAGHGQIPGFTPPELNQQERQRLIDWQRNNNRESKSTINNSPRR